MDTARTTMFLLGAATGAGIVYLFHPDCGRTRRRRIVDQAQDKALSTARTVTDEVNAGLDHARNTMMGAVAEALPDERPENDQALVSKVRSEVLGGATWSAYTINVDACDGVVTLRGQVDRSEQISELEDDVRGVTGVEEVENHLHVPGVEPPNTAAARRASTPRR
jgi:osmotically-inducible protein OsmY